jgi:hypothetical protein
MDLLTKFYYGKSIQLEFPMFADTDKTLVWSLYNNSKNNINGCSAFSESKQQINHHHSAGNRPIVRDMLLQEVKYFDDMYDKMLKNVVVCLYMNCKLKPQHGSFTCKKHSEQGITHRRDWHGNIVQCQCGPCTMSTFCAVKPVTCKCRYCAYYESVAFLPYPIENTLNYKNKHCISCRCKQCSCPVRREYGLYEDQVLAKRGFIRKLLKWNFNTYTCGCRICRHITF